MRTRTGGFLALVCLGFLLAADSEALANRVFVSARSGNDANGCDDITTPCKTFAGAVTQLNPDGEVIVLDSGGYGPVTITQGVTIEAPAGVTAFIHPPSGDAITINAGGSDTVTLRGLTLSVGGIGNGITVTSVGMLNVINCFIRGFFHGIQMNSGGKLNLKGSDVTECGFGVSLENNAGTAQVSIDHCHLDGNVNGFFAATTSPGGSTTSASYSTANNNGDKGWWCGSFSTGRDVLILEFCTGSGNNNGLLANSTNAQSVVRYSNSTFSNNSNNGAQRAGDGTVESRGNNTITGNGNKDTVGTIGSFPAR